MYHKVFFLFSYRILLIDSPVLVGQSCSTELRVELA